MFIILEIKKIEMFTIGDTDFAVCRSSEKLQI